MNVTEFLKNDVGKLLYDECWKMWKEGIEKLSQADKGMEAAEAKQQMKDAVRILKMPMRKLQGTDAERKTYGDALAAKETRKMKDHFEKEVNNAG